MGGLGIVPAVIRQEVECAVDRSSGLTHIQTQNLLKSAVMSTVPHDKIQTATNPNCHKSRFHKGSPPPPQKKTLGSVHLLYTVYVHTHTKHQCCWLPDAQIACTDNMKQAISFVWSSSTVNNVRIKDQMINQEFHYLYLLVLHSEEHLVVQCSVFYEHLKKEWHKVAPVQTFRFSESSGWQ